MKNYSNKKIVKSHTVKNANTTSGEISTPIGSMYYFLNLNFQLGNSIVKIIAVSPQFFETRKRHKVNIIKFLPMGYSIRFIFIGKWGTLQFVSGLPTFLLT